MEHAEQVRILKGLMQHLDEGTNVDAGKVVKNPVSSYLCADRGKLEWECFFADYPQVLGLSGGIGSSWTILSSARFFLLGIWYRIHTQSFICRGRP